MDLSIQGHVFVFVYGTLKRGLQYSHVLNDQTFLGETTTTADYRMYSLGDYPGLKEVEPGSGVQVQGEIYRVDQTCLRNLDQVEAVDQGLYERHEIRLDAMKEPNPPEWLKLPLELGTMAYFYLGDVSDCDDCNDCW